MAWLKCKDILSTFHALYHLIFVITFVTYIYKQKPREVKKFVWDPIASKRWPYPAYVFSCQTVQ